jgi:ParB-like chromosome segregation protein Spo0J
MELSMSVPRVETIPIGKLRPNRRNARTHSKKQIGQIANSIRRFGWTYPILIGEDHEIIAGFGRWKAAEHLGLQEVPVMVMTGLSDLEKRALALADNKVAANAGWDRAVLAAELGDLAALLPKCDLTIDITGFEPAEIDGLMGDLIDAEPPADEAPAIGTVPVSYAGDLWLLDRHRLLCADAAAASDMAKLMAAATAAMVITAPPRQIKQLGSGAAAAEPSGRPLIGLLVDSLSLAAKHSADGSIHFVFVDEKHLRETLAAGDEVYGGLKNLIVWVRSKAGQGGFYRSQHQLILVFAHGDAAHQNAELRQHRRARSDVWHHADVVAVAADAMRDGSRRGDVVLDPFMGTGSTIAAAEGVGRRAYGIEFNPLNVDAAVRRWQALTKRDAVLAGTTTTFDEVAVARSAMKQGGRK